MDSRISCLGLSRARIAGVCHHSWLPAMLMRVVCHRHLQTRFQTCTRNEGCLRSVKPKEAPEGLCLGSSRLRWKLFSPQCLWQGTRSYACPEPPYLFPTQRDEFPISLYNSTLESLSLLATLDTRSRNQFRWLPQKIVDGWSDQRPSGTSASQGQT
jgi:hypothetical protein